MHSFLPRLEAMELNSVLLYAWLITRAKLVPRQPNNELRLEERVSAVNAEQSYRDE